MPIEAVNSRHREAALAFICGGGRKDVCTQAKVQVLLELVRSRDSRYVRLWWSRFWLTCRAAAMVVENPGRTGMVFFPPAHGPQVNLQAQQRLLEAISGDAIKAGLSVVQALLSPEARQDSRMLIDAGYSTLAELIYMRKETQPGAVDLRGLTWRFHGQFDDAHLAGVIESTYAQSLDCPMLYGRRKMKDIIAGHKAAGLFCPQQWHVVYRNDEPAGCVLVNDVPEHRGAEIVYLGVCPAHRGRGIAATLLQRANAEAHRRGRQWLTLAVDANNRYAKNVYISEGFREIDRRVALAMLAPAR